jgi:hypothetical protein
MRQIKGYIQIYSKKARDQVTEAGQKFLGTAGLDIIWPELFACVDELIKNAVKANYKFLLLKEKIAHQFMQLWPDKSHIDIEEDIRDIIKMPESFNRVAGEVLKNEDISGTVREILNQESKLLGIKNRAYSEKRRYTAEELNALSGLEKINDIRKKIRNNDIRILLRIQADNDFLYIEITNTAPILAKDLVRIHEKREEYRRCRDEGREHEFFINNIDTSESGFGLGYAKIDSILADWGLADERAITIISAINTTVMLTLPVDHLKERFN